MARKVSIQMTQQQKFIRHEYNAMMVRAKEAWDMSQPGYSNDLAYLIFKRDESAVLYGIAARMRDFYIEEPGK